MIRALAFILFPLNVWAANIAYIGDSQSASNGAVFSQLYTALNANGNRVQTARAICGAEIDWFLSERATPSNCDYKGQTYLQITRGRGGFIGGKGATASLQSLVNGSDLAVIQLGDNHLANPAEVPQFVESLVKSILLAGKGCVWIGPASIGPAKNGKTCDQNRARKQKVSAAIEAALKKTSVNGKTCSFVDSYKLTASRPPEGDPDMCLHYRNRGYSNWGDAIRSRVEAAIAEQTSRGSGATRGTTNSAFEVQGEAGATREGKRP